MQYWKQGRQNFMVLPTLQNYGLNVAGDDLTVVWDSDTNVKKVKATIQWYTKGCSCRSGCATQRCSCRRSANKHCSPGCKCLNCVNLPDCQDLAASDSEPDLEESEPENTFFSTDSESDSKIPMEILEIAATADIANYWDTFENYLVL